MIIYNKITCHICPGLGGAVESEVADSLVSSSGMGINWSFRNPLELEVMWTWPDSLRRSMLSSTLLFYLASQFYCFLWVLLLSYIISNEKKRLLLRSYSSIYLTISVSSVRAPTRMQWRQCMRSLSAIITERQTNTLGIHDQPRLGKGVGSSWAPAW